MLMSIRNCESVNANSIARRNIIGAGVPAAPPKWNFHFLHLARSDRVVHSAIGLAQKAQPKFISTSMLVSMCKFQHLQNALRQSIYGCLWGGFGKRHHLRALGPDH